MHVRPSFVSAGEWEGGGGIHGRAYMCVRVAGEYGCGTEGGRTSGACGTISTLFLVGGQC